MTSDLRLTLEDPEDFRRFKVKVDAAAEPETVAAALAPLAGLEDRDTAWVDEAALRRLGPEGDAWQAGLSKMIAAAAPHGWVHPQTGAIRAHVEWTAA
ncbi:hypothetical protein [Acuticoccus mangrovi]|uniref:Uncharacterized protein n=1 Tax=Acuticoccus mangrovi TaxID=2796142 RepID=A0A934IQA5_9HYPH|nr:hypothetical protein [Acuticoccus mangrovi]MBJ3775644.1 hypothetical protein [Acuticoccus mangrovi]